jgi:hypothetical protein
VRCTREERRAIVSVLEPKFRQNLIKMVATTGEPLRNKINDLHKCEGEIAH